MELVIDPQIDANERWREAVRSISKVFEDLLGSTATGTKLVWRPAQDSNGRWVLLLTLSNFGVEVSGTFVPEEAEAPYLRYRLVRLWGDLLQARSHKQLEEIQKTDGV